MTLRLLICDSVPIMRDGLCTALGAESDIDVVGTTDSGIHASMLVRTMRPDVVLTGLKLQGFSGLEMIRRLANEPLDPVPRFVVLTMSTSDDVIDSVLRAGVNGLLVKEATREELSFAIRAAARGQTALAPQIAHRLVDWFRRSKTSPDKLLSLMVAELTPRERQVLLLVARGLSAEEVAGELGIGVATARTHLYRLTCKLRLRDRAQLVAFAYRAGLMQVSIHGSG